MDEAIINNLKEAVELYYLEDAPDCHYKQNGTIASIIRQSKLPEHLFE